MNRFVKSAAVLGLAGAMALAMATPSEAAMARNAAAIGAGVAGFALGAAVGSADANSGYYYTSGLWLLVEPGYALLRLTRPTSTYAYAPRHGLLRWRSERLYAPASYYSAHRIRNVKPARGPSRPALAQASSTKLDESG